LESYSRAVANGDPAEPDKRGSEPSPSSPDRGGVSSEDRQAPNDIRDVSFPVSVRGYDRRAVDAYVTRVDRLITELEETRSPEGAVKHALEQAGERISGILQQAGETGEEIATTARQKAEESTARAEEESEAIVAKASADADEVLGRSKAEAEAMLAQARKEADERLQRAQEEVTALREKAEARMRELHADTEAIREQRRLLLDDMREMASRVEEAASGADARFPPPEPAESAQEGMEETKPDADAETEQRSIAAADEPRRGKAGHTVRPRS
jgi:DivIVA domain-containing protein